MVVCKITVMLPVSCIPRRLYRCAVIPKTQGTSKCVCAGIFLTELCDYMFSRCFTVLVCMYICSCTVLL